MKRVLPTSAVLLLAFLVMLASCAREDPLGRMGIANHYLSGFAFQNGNKLIGIRGDAMVRITSHEMGREEAAQYANSRLFVLQSLYRETPSPYPGAVTRAIACQERFLPLLKEHEPFDYLILLATERLTYGACSDDLVAFGSIVYFLYCPETLHEIDLFFPLGEDVGVYEERLTETACMPSTAAR